MWSSSELHNSAVLFNRMLSICIWTACGSWVLFCFFYFSPYRLSSVKKWIARWNKSKQQGKKKRELACSIWLIWCYASCKSLKIPHWFEKMLFLLAERVSINPLQWRLRLKMLIPSFKSVWDLRILEESKSTRGTVKPSYVVFILFTWNSCILILIDQHLEHPIVHFMVGRISFVQLSLHWCIKECFRVAQFGLPRDSLFSHCEVFQMDNSACSCAGHKSNRTQCSVVALQ